jgi:hypothetical protein
MKKDQQTEENEDVHLQNSERKGIVTVHYNFEFLLKLESNIGYQPTYSWAIQN